MTEIVTPRGYRPTRDELAAAIHKTVPDVIAPGLHVLFCGINPGLYTAAIGHHFGRPGNRFWPALHASGLTDRLLTPWDERDLLSLGLGITNLVARTTVAASELSSQELTAGGQELERKIREYHPAWLGVLGIGAYRTAFGRPRAALGLQPESIGETRVWVLPNTSGLNAHFRPDDFAAAFRALREATRA